MCVVVFAWFCYVVVFVLCYLNFPQIIKNIYDEFGFSFEYFEVERLFDK